MKKVLLLLFALNATLNGDCQSGTDFWKRGNTQFDSGNYKQAIIQYNISIVKTPGFIDAYLKRADAKLELNDFKGAIVDYNTAIKLEGGYKEVYCSRGIAKSKLNNHIGALEDFNTSLNFCPRYPAAYYHRGLEYIILKQLASGCSDLEKSRQLGFEKAIEALKENCYRQPGEEFYARGIAILDRYDSIPNFKQAILEFDKAIELNPYYVEAHMGRAKAKTGLKDFQGALLIYNKVVEIDPKFGQAYMNRAYLKVKLSESSEVRNNNSALADIDKVVTLDPNNFQSYLDRAYFKCTALLDYRSAIVDYDIAIQLNPKNIDSYTSRGMAKFNMGRKKDGCLDLQYAAELKDYWGMELFKEKCK